MPFTLRISMTGLCMFVPVPRAPDGPCLHALLLSHHHDEHLPRLIYDKAHEKKGSGGSARKLGCIPLIDGELRFIGLGTSIPSDPQAFCTSGESCDPYRLPKVVAPMDELGCSVQPVDRALLRPNPPSLVAARASIYEGRLIKCAPGDPWRTKAGVKPSLTPAIIWAIDISAESLTVTVDPLRSSATFKPWAKTLYPMGGVLDLAIYNAPEKDLPPVTRRPDEYPGKDQEAEHFGPYFDVVGAPQCKQGGIPVLDRNPTPPNPLNTPSDCKPGPFREDAMSDVAVMPFDILSAHTSTCVTAQSPPK